MSSELRRMIADIIYSANWRTGNDDFYMEDEDEIADWIIETVIKALNLREGRWIQE